MTYEDIKKCVFNTPLANPYHGATYLIAIQDNEGHCVASKAVAEKLGYDVLVRLTIISNQKTYEILDVK